MLSVSAGLSLRVPAGALPRSARARRPPPGRTPRVVVPRATAASCCAAVVQSAAYTTATVLATSVVTYTAWEAPASFKTSSLADVLLLRKGLGHSARLLNKAASVAGLALVALAFLPHFAAQSSQLTFNALALLGAHAAYSVVRFYGTPVIPKVQTWLASGVPRPGPDGAAAVKILARVLGGMAQQCLAAGTFQLVSRAVLAYGVLSLGAAHFLAERADRDGVPRVAPAGVAALALAAVALVSVATGVTAA